MFEITLMFQFEMILICLAFSVNSKANFPRLRGGKKQTVRIFTWLECLPSSCSLSGRKTVLIFVLIVYVFSG